MQGKDSISFGSIRESSVWHNQDPPGPGQNLSVTFQQMPASSRSYLEGSMIRKIPADKSSQEINKFMQKNLDVVCLLQAAEIRRLISNLEEHQIKFKQLQSQPLDRQSYQIQIRQLAETSHSLQVSNEQMRGRGQKLKQFIVKQNVRIDVIQVEIEKLSEQLRKSEHASSEIAEYRQELMGYKRQIASYQEQLQQTHRKYQKAIESLNKVFDDNQHLTTLSGQLSEQNSQLKQQIELLKQHFIQTVERKDAFEEERIREIQRMRESFETKMFQTSTQITRQTENQLAEDKHHYHQLINSLNGKLADLDSASKSTQQRLAVLTEENQKLVEQVKEGYKELQEERDKINEERTDFNEKFKLFGDEIQRLNTILGQKQTRIKATLTQVQRSRQSLQQLSKQKQTFSQTITQLNQQKSSLSSQLTTAKQQLLHHMKQQDQNGSSLLQTRKHLQHYLQKEHDYQLTISEHQKLVDKLKQQIRALQEQAKVLKMNVQTYQSKLSQIMQTSSETSMSKQLVIRNYEQKIRDYFEQNLALKHEHDTLNHEHQTVAEQNITLKQQLNSLASNITHDHTHQLQTLKRNCHELRAANTLVEAKVKSLEREKHSIEKQLQKQILYFMENNHKTETMLHEHNHNVQMVNYQQQYSKNHCLLLKQIETMSKDFLLKQDQLLQKQSLIQKLEKQIKKLIAVIESLETHNKNHQDAVVDDMNSHAHQLKHINLTVSQLSLEKELTVQNSQLHKQLHQLQQNLSHANQDLSHAEQLTHKSIELTTQNVRLRHELEKTTSELVIYKSHTQSLEQSLALIKAQYTYLIEEKQQLLKGLHQRATIIEQQNKHKEQNMQDSQNHHSIQDAQVNKNIELLLQQFKHLNQSLMAKLNQIQLKQHHAMQQLNQSTKPTTSIISHQAQFPSSNQLQSSKQLLESQPHIFHQNQSHVYQQQTRLTENASSVYPTNQSNIFGQNLFGHNQSQMLSHPIESQTQMSFNPSKFLQTTKLPQQNTESIREFINQLRQQIQALEQRTIQSEQELVIYKEKHHVLQLKNQQYEQTIRKHQILQASTQVKLKELQQLTQINAKLITENNTFIQENESLLQSLHQKQLQLKENQHLLHDYNLKFASLSQHTDHFSTQLTTLEQQNSHLTEQSSHLQKQTQQLSLALELSQKQSQNLTAQLHNLTQQLNRHTQQQLLLQNKTSHLEHSNYNYALEIQKQKLAHNKIIVLNHELERLEKQNLDLIEQLDICKFQICSDVSLERRNQELLTILVLTFAQIESLRSRVKEKDAELTTIRKSNLKPHRHLAN